MPFRVVSKKDEEKFYLDRFKEHSEDFPDGDAEEAEAPDFIVHTADGPIGIEITKLFWNATPNEPPRQKRESVHDVIANNCIGIHSKSGLPACHVSIHFDNKQLSMKDARRMSEQVYNVVANNLPGPGELRRMPPNSWSTEYLPDGVVALGIYRPEDMPEPFYAAPQFDWVPDLDPEADLQRRAIDSKHQKIDEYRKKCNEIWLLINVGFGSISSQFDIPESVYDHVYQSTFDRIYLLDQIAKTCIRLDLAE